MINDLFIIIIALALMSFLQRFLPWAFYSRLSSEKSLQRVFDMLAISAFTALFVYNVQTLDPVTLISLAVAFVVVLRTRNLGLTVIAAMAISIIYILI